MEFKINLRRTCRTCAENFEDDLHPIFSSDNINILKMLEGFRGFDFKISKHDNLPKRLCDNCSKQLTQIYLFILQCERSEKILTQRLQKNITLKVNAPTKTCMGRTESIGNDLDNNGHEADDTFSLLEQELTIEESFNIISKNDDKFIRQNSKLEKINTNTCKDKQNVDVDDKKQRSDVNYINIRSKINSLIKKYYKCTSCLITFDKFSNFREHKKEKHQIEPISYLCDVCGKEFNKRDRLQQHKNRHAGLKPFKCDICAKSFSIKGSLRSHMQRHVNPQNFTCKLCGKNFVIKKCYEEHLKRHESDAKLFKCPYCPRTFKLLSTLTHHCTFHNKTLDKKYHCNECNTNFRRSDHLKEHINGVHLKILPFKCKLCSQAFVTGAKRNIHMKRMHSGKRYKCNQCEKDFSLPSSLNRHKKNHSGIKSLICEICNESFVTPIQIEKHMKTHQLDESAKSKLIIQTYENIKHIAINQDEIADSKIF